MFHLKTKTVGQVFLSIVMLCLSQFVSAATSTAPLPGSLAARTFVEITPSGGFAAGDQLNSVTVDLSSFTDGGGGTIEGDLAVVVAPATPDGANAVWYSLNSGGYFTAGASDAWTSLVGIVVGNNTLTLATPVGLSGQRIFVGNAYSGSGTWNGSVTFNYSQVVIPNAVPAASAISISGISRIGSQLSGVYTYSDSDSDVEGASAFRWVSNNANTGVSGGTDVAATRNYNPAAGDLGRYLYFCVTPVAVTGTTPGVEVCSAASAAVAQVAEPTPIPTLSEWAMIIMASLMALFAMSRMRKQG